MDNQNYQRFALIRTFLFLYVYFVQLAQKMSSISKKKVAFECSFVELRGGSKIFSRGQGADFQKKLEIFDDLFLRLTKLIFQALQKH